MSLACCVLLRIDAQSIFAIQHPLAFNGAHRILVSKGLPSSLIIRGTSQDGWGDQGVRDCTLLLRSIFIDGADNLQKHINRGPT